MAEAIDLSVVTDNPLQQVVTNLVQDFEIFANRFDLSVKIFGERVAGFSGVSRSLVHFAGNFGATSAAFLKGVSELREVLEGKVKTAIEGSMITIAPAATSEEMTKVAQTFQTSMGEFKTATDNLNQSAKGLVEATKSLTAAVTSIGSIGGGSGRRRASSNRARDENGRFIPKDAPETASSGGGSLGGNTTTAIVPYVPKEQHGLSTMENFGLGDLKDISDRIKKVSEVPNQPGKGRVYGSEFKEEAQKVGSKWKETAAQFFNFAKAGAGSLLGKVGAGFLSVFKGIPAMIGQALATAIFSQAAVAFEPLAKAAAASGNAAASTMKYLWVNMVEEFGMSRAFTGITLRMNAFARSLNLATDRMQQRNGGSSADALLGSQAQAAQVGDSVIQSIKDAMISPMTALPAFGKMLSSFVSLYNPGVANSFNLALRDMTAVVGKALTPVLKGVTEAVRYFSDYLNGFLDAGVGKELQGLVDSFLEKFKERMPQLIVLLDYYAQNFVKEIDQFIGSIERGITVVNWWGEMLATVAKGTIQLFTVPTRYFLTACQLVLDGAAMLFNGLAELLGKIPGIGFVLEASVKPLGSGLKGLADMTGKGADGIKSMEDAVYEGVRGLFGGGELDGLQKKLANADNLFKPKDSKGLAVAQGVKFTSSSEFGKSAAQASFLSSIRDQQSEKQKQADANQAIIDLVNNPAKIPLIGFLFKGMEKQGAKENAWKAENIKGGIIDSGGYGDY